MVVIKNNANFTVKNVKKVGTLTLDNVYTVVAIGFNGHLKMENDNGRYCWYNSENFEMIDSSLRCNGVVIVDKISFANMTIEI